MAENIKLSIEKEIAPNRFKVIVKKHGFLCGFLVGYLYPKLGIMKCYPKKLTPGTFRESELPLTVRYDDIPWRRN